jgi:hypothetical protein
MRLLQKPSEISTEKLLTSFEIADEAISKSENRLSSELISSSKKHLPTRGGSEIRLDDRPLNQIDFFTKNFDDS